jgi:hypothetical protein
MGKTFKDAVAEVATLPEPDQEKIGRDLLAHVEKLRALRADLAAGLRSLDEGQGTEVDIEDVIRRARDRHGKP